MSVDPKQRFLDDVFFSNTIQGAFQRVKTYPDKWTDQQKIDFKGHIREFLNNLKNDYRTIEVSHQQHISNIGKLLDIINGHLGEERSFGRAQKLLNLFLKYYWCIDAVKTPPHCPVDSIVLEKAGISGVKWSKMDCAEYQEVVHMLRQVAEKTGYSNIADWELEAFNTAINERSKVFQCKCDDPDCGKCLVVNCKDNNCTIHTLERKLAQRKLRGLPTG